MDWRASGLLLGFLADLFFAFVLTSRFSRRALFSFLQLGDPSLKHKDRLLLIRGLLPLSSFLHEPVLVHCKAHESLMGHFLFRHLIGFALTLHEIGELLVIRLL